MADHKDCAQETKILFLFACYTTTGKETGAHMHQTASMATHALPAKEGTPFQNAQIDALTHTLLGIHYITQTHQGKEGNKYNNENKNHK